MLAASAARRLRAAPQGLPAPPPTGALWSEAQRHACGAQDAEQRHAAALDEHRRGAEAALARARAQVTAAQARAYAEQGALAAQARAPAHQLLDLYPVIVPHRAGHILACSAAVEAACLRRRLPIRQRTAVLLPDGLQIAGADSHPWSVPAPASTSALLPQRPLPCLAGEWQYPSFDRNVTREPGIHSMRRPSAGAAPGRARG